ncbi:hypothetical protein [Paenibacillus illinoisensis]|uniref:hypothetical protein n=1 Tax=Paenibacillus illinoisensis TaxID=59845 RepID=UPI001C8E7257|nr:hypothetical protein [Paenibacillus illinoisensis]
MANHIHGPIPPSVYRIFGTIGVSQIIISYYVWKAECFRMQGKDDADKTASMTGPIIRGALISLVLCGTLLIPNLLAIGGVWILAYGSSFMVVFMFLSKYMLIRQDRRALQSKEALSRSS